MKESVFSVSELTCCKVPTPKGYPQSQTHAGIAVIEDCYYLTTSPYPSIHRNAWSYRFRRLLNIMSFGRIRNFTRAESYENPFIYFGNKENENPPIKFSLLQSRPLMDTPDNIYGYPCYNSDPDIYTENGLFYILNRSVLRTKVYQDGRPYDSKTRIYLITGERECNSFKMISNDLVREWDRPYASPCLIKVKGKYLFTYIDSNSANDGQTFNGIFYSISDSIDMVKKNKENNKLTISGSDLLPWHMSLFVYKDKLYTIIACVQKGNKSKIWQMFGKFNDDLSDLYIFSKPLTIYNSYRGAAYVDDSGQFVLYTTTVHERIENGESVDGREILMGKMPFELLMKRLEEK